MPAQQLQLFQKQRPHGTPTKHVSGFVLALGSCRVPGQGGSRRQAKPETISPSGNKYRLQSRATKACLIETASFHAGTSEEVRLRRQIYASCTPIVAHASAAMPTPSDPIRARTRATAGVAPIFSEELCIYPPQQPVYWEML